MGTEQSTAASRSPVEPELTPGVASTPPLSTEPTNNADPSTIGTNSEDSESAKAVPANHSASGNPVELSLSVKAELSAYSHGSRHNCWSVVGVKAPFYEAEVRVPVDIVAVIDVSGSMGGEKLNLVKKTLLFMITQLKECDRFSLVTYDSNVKRQFELLKMTENNKKTANSVVASLKVGSSTNLSGGLLRGMQEIISTNSQKANVRSVLLLTDGQATAGVTTREGVLQEMKKLQDQNKGFDGTVYTFGFGSDHNAGMLEAISTQGGGVYYYIDTNEKIPESFADCLGGLLSVVGQNLSLKLEAQGVNEISEVHTNRSINWTTKNKQCEIPLGDIQSEEGRDIVLTVILPALDSPQEDCVLKVTLSYFNAITSTMQTITNVFNVSRTDGNPGNPDISVDEQRNRISATSAMQRAQTAANEGKMEQAQSILNEAITVIERSVSSTSDLSKAFVADMKKSLSSLVSREAYLSHGQNYMCSKVQSHVAQRSNYVDDDDDFGVSSSKCYSSKAKSSYRKKASFF